MTFWIGAAECSLRISFSGSLKERRYLVQSLLSGARSRFNIATADLGPPEMWNLADLGFTATGSSRSELEVRLQNLERFLRQREADGEFEILHYSREVFSYGDLSD